jgi:hypothetical protein
LVEVTIAHVLIRRPHDLAETPAGLFVIAIVTTVPRLGYSAAMKRVLITGMSGTGKSTLIHALSALGYKAIDTDSDYWSEWAYVTDPVDPSSAAEPDWIWREDRIRRLLSIEDSPVLFVSACKTNQGKFYGQFDHIVLLSAPARLIVERLATRTTIPSASVLKNSLEYCDTCRPLSRCSEEPRPWWSIRVRLSKKS